MAGLETVRKAIAEGDADFLREGVRVLAQGGHGSRGDRAHRGAPR
jgi:hypothetical protein